ncbi:MAG: hypothetical protein ACOC16_02585 [Nanoarchaeota archaeon]
MRLIENQIEDDLEILLERFNDSLFPKNTSQVASLALDILIETKNDFDNIDKIKKVYLQDARISSFIPISAYEILYQYTQGNLQKKTAKNLLVDVTIRYQERFQQLGLNLDSTSI